LLAALFSMRPAKAYVLPTDALFDLWAKRRERVKSDTQQVSGRLTVIDAAGTRRVVQATHSLHFPGDCRFEIDEASEDALASQHVTIRADKLVKGADAPVELLTAFEQQLCLLLGFKEGGAEEIARRVKLLGLKTGYTGLDRLEDQTAFVLGEEAANDQEQRATLDTKPVLWLDKEKSLPVLFRKDGMELQLLGYGDPATGEWHPQELRFYLNKTLRFRFQADRLDQNIELDPELFRK